MQVGKLSVGLFIVTSLVLSACQHVHEERYASGNLKERTERNSAGVPHGKTSIYYENGALRAEGAYVDGLRSGQWRWYDSTGVFNLSGSYENGAQEGKFTEYFPSGQPKCTTIFSDGIKNGPTTTFHPNGRTASIVTYRQGMLNDTSWFFYPSGNLSMLSVAENDTVVMYIEYDSTGVKRHQFNLLQ